MDERYPGYDVLSKRHTPSWNDKTRQVIDQRLAVSRDPRFLSEDEYATLIAIADRITPQPRHRPPVPVAALVDDKLRRDDKDGYRAPEMPQEREAWRRGLAALNAEAQTLHGKPFRNLDGDSQDGLLRQMESGDLHHPAWGGMPPKLFFKQRMVTDIVRAYWCYPTAWNEMGFGGPASPRGYVRLGYNERDPWEAMEAGSDPERARRVNRNVG